ncbi:alpha-tubulin N-acetyltransferase 1-like isoform X2 [Achroia grisella]|uniref:alpha-tubulin N-acetyltransferase 1-like isoform X2 n=1 Tax=Achroia grisella TaxID=688607 RepID=UPI0027D29627|nr:alpha-tubulin N-acetyltransferase 1-like isoform X2 [Achroia grisella]
MCYRGRDVLLYELFLRLMQNNLSKLIDWMGEQSASAQGLSNVLTSAEKLRNSPTQVLYMLKDENAKSGKGEVVGILKVSRKHLILYEEQDKVLEVEPLCVLDFFVLPSHQRHGCGRLLFDNMLKEYDCSPFELAIDGPSKNMTDFLRKNYGMENLLFQYNNFAVAPDFFSHIKKARPNSSESTPASTPAVGRYTAHRPPSVIASVIHGGYNDNVYNGSENGIPVEQAEFAIEESSPVELAAKPQLERPRTLPVPIPPKPAPAASANRDLSRPVSPDGSSGRRDPQLTDRGFFDVKFYHNKLW